MPFTFLLVFYRLSNRYTKQVNIAQTLIPAERRHFHTFDALRFFAFFKVFLLHLPITALPWFNYIRAGGGIGVQFFFVLSGFLITYIILEEKNRTGQFNLRHFFARRILRIWPLYYLMILVAFLTPIITENVLHVATSAEGYEPEWWKSLLFLENYKMMATGEHPNVSPLGVMWSLCIEEHFYIIWGLLLYFIPVRRLPVVIVSAILVGYFSRLFYDLANIPALDIFTNIDLFAFGAVPGYLLITRRFATENALLRVPLWVKLLFAAVVVVVVQVFSQYTSDDAAFVTLTTVLGVMFAVLISFTIPQHTRFSISDKNILSRLGLYTYGLYLYHTIIISLLRAVYPALGMSTDTPGGAVLFIIIALLATIAVSIASYYIFERPFLKLKKFFR